MIEIIDDTSGERMIVSNLTIIMADPSDAGKYMCMATNIAGQDTAAAELTVYGKWLPLTLHRGWDGDDLRTSLSLPVMPNTFELFLLKMVLLSLLPYVLLQLQKSYI